MGDTPDQEYDDGVDELGNVQDERILTTDDLREQHGLESNPSQPLILVAPRRKPTLRQLSWALANTVVVNLLFAAAFALVIMVCWNGLVDLTTLPVIEWREAFAAVILLRTAALAARL